VGNPIAAINSYFLLGFPFSAVTAVYVLRKFGITTFTAAGVAILFSFLPYRFLRNEAHLIYASYLLVPLAIMVALWVARVDALFRFYKEALRYLSCLIFSLEDVNRFNRMLREYDKP
jgi:hypothetical protein